MPKQYDALEGTLTVRAAAAATRTGATNAAVVIGGYDEANADGSVTAGEAQLVTDPTGAEDTYGDSELPRAIEAVAANGVGTIYAVPVPETSTTETYAASQSLSLSEAPVFDPRVHPDHDITVAEDTTGDGAYDTELATTVTYESPPPTPSEADTAVINPITGEIETDAAGDYEVSYVYGDYGTAIDAAVDQPVRSVIALTEAPSVKSTLQTALADYANDFDFMRGYVGATPEIAAGDISSYTPDVEDWRLVEVAPARATGSDGEVRTAAAVGGHMSAQPIGPDGSGLFEPVQGILDLNTAYRASEATQFEQVTALTRNGTVARAKTASPKANFADIYAVEVIDRVAVGLFEAARSYAGGPQDLGDLETLLGTKCQAFSRGSPPLLGFADDRDERPYDINVTLGASSSEADAGVSIVPYPIAEEVNLSLTVADGFVGFEGAT